MAQDIMSSLPKWLTEDYIAVLLCKNRKTDLQIKIIDVDRASEPGDNYLGSLYRITVECILSKKFLIVKILPSENQGSIYVSSFGVFGRELEVYHQILPKLYGVMKEKLGRIECFSPYCYPTTRSDAIILEDLRPLGYKMEDRMKQLDLDHALPVLNILAKLHAFSFVLGSESYRHYHDVFLSRENRHLTGNYKTSIVKSLCRTVSKWEGFEKIASSLWRFSERALDDINEVVAPREGSFCVLNHGDCWTTNILFRYCPETGKVQDVKLIDYQLSRYSTPALDLIYFFYTSLRLDVWKQRDRLLKHYHSELIRWLSCAGVSTSVYTFQDLQTEMKEKLPYAFAITATMQAIAVADPGIGPDMDKLFQENGNSPVSEYSKAHNTDRYRKNVQEFLLYFEKEGLFSAESGRWTLQGYENGN